jgi:glycosyltransferase involved in cell wall biosynthesis
LIFIIKVKSPKLTAVGKLVAEYVEFGTCHKALPIQNGMNIADFSFSAPASTIKLVGSIGRLDKEKNYLNLILAIPNISSKFTLEIAGEGVQRNLLEETVYQEKIRNVNLIGFQSDIISFHNKIQGFVCSSYHEGCNLSFIESILLGNPVISTNVGVAYDFPELDFPRMENDKVSMSSSIDKWLKSPLEELQEKAKYNRVLAEKLFCIEAVYNIYREKIWIV